MECDVLGFTPLEYYFFNIEDNYNHYADKLYKDSKNSALSAGTTRSLSLIYNMNLDDLKKSIYWTDKYLHTLMHEANLSKKVEQILKALY